MRQRLITASGGVVGHSADAILIGDGLIAGIGTASALRSPGTEEIEHAGAFIAPPMHDHHFHPIGYAGAVTGLSLKHARDFADLTELLRSAAAELLPDESLIGNRLDDEAVVEGRLPTRHDLDVMVSDRPVLLYRYCGHVAVVNTKALEMAGLPAHPTGILTEAEVQTVSNVVGTRQPLLQPDAVRRALLGLVSLGLQRITAIVSAGEPIWCGVPNEIETLIEIAPDVPLDFKVLVIADSPAILTDAAERLERASSNVTFFGWKEFADGSLGGRTAALYEPYSDDPDNTGILRLDQRRATVMAKASLDLGGVVAIHAIGDLANDMVLDVHEELIKEGADAGKLRIEHASVLTDAAIDRMARLSVTASVQPAFITSEVDWLAKRLGSRTERTYSLRRLLEAGVGLLGGSDCPVESPNPWWGMASAQGPGLLAPSAAFGLFAEDLRIGDPADFLIVPRNPLTVSPDYLRQMTVQHVYRRGEEVKLLSELPFT